MVDSRVELTVSLLVTSYPFVAFFFFTVLHIVDVGTDEIFSPCDSHRKLSTEVISLW